MSVLYALKFHDVSPITSVCPNFHYRLCSQPCDSWSNESMSASLTITRVMHKVLVQVIIRPFHVCASFPLVHSSPSTYRPTHNSRRHVTGTVTFQIRKTTISSCTVQGASLCGLFKLSEVSGMKPYDFCQRVYFNLLNWGFGDKWNIKIFSIFIIWDSDPRLTRLAFF